MHYHFMFQYFPLQRYLFSLTYNMEYSKFRRNNGSTTEAKSLSLDSEFRAWLSPCRNNGSTTEAKPLSLDSDVLVKLIIIGESSVGKSCIMQRYCDDIYEENDYMSTIGVDFKMKPLVSNGKKIRVHIWDTAGQERFRSIINIFYRDVNCVMLVFDLTNYPTLNKLSIWINEIKAHSTNDYKIILVGNKCERDPSKIVIQNDEIESFATQHNLTYIAVSAKNNINIEKAFTELIMSHVNSMASKKITPDDTTAEAAYGKPPLRHRTSCWC